MAAVTQGDGAGCRMDGLDMQVVKMGGAMELRCSDGGGSFVNFNLMNKMTLDGCCYFLMGFWRPSSLSEFNPYKL